MLNDSRDKGSNELPVVRKLVQPLKSVLSRVELRHDSLEIGFRLDGLHGDRSIVLDQDLSVFSKGGTGDDNMSSFVSHISSSEQVGKGESDSDDDDYAAHDGDGNGQSSRLLTTLCERHGRHPSFDAIRSTAQTEVVHSANGDSEEDAAQTSLPERVGPVGSESEKCKESGSRGYGCEDQGKDDGDGSVRRDEVREAERGRIVHQSDWTSAQNYVLYPLVNPTKMPEKTIRQRGISIS